MRTVEMLKHGRRESHCGREGVGGHNEAGLGYTSHCDLPECGTLRCTFCEVLPAACCVFVCCNFGSDPTTAA